MPMLNNRNNYYSIVTPLRYSNIVFCKTTIPRRTTLCQLLSANAQCNDDDLFDYYHIFVIIILYILYIVLWPA
jgi:hypothetical protein